MRRWLLICPLLLAALPPAHATGRADRLRAQGPGRAEPMQLADDEYRRPGGKRVAPTPEPELEFDPGAVAPPQPWEDGKLLPVPDRWRLIDNLGVVTPSIWDPYNPNPLKGDRPLWGKDWFVSLNLIEDFVFEPRAIPTPVGVQTTGKPGRIDVFGEIDQYVLNNNLILNLTILKGDTAYKPPDYEIRITPVVNHNYADVQEKRALYADPTRGTTRADNHVGLQELFIDKHLRNVSDRYDFDSIRVGIQPFNADFRGFLFQDNQMGVRLFGTRDNNLWQYNLAWFRRVEKDTNSGLNDLDAGLRDDDVFLANLYRQDFPFLGMTTQGTVAWNRNREAGEVFYDANGFLARPASIGDQRGRDYDVVYLGLNMDGRVDRWNLSGSAYLALGEDDHNQFTGQKADIRAWFLAAEPSIDFSWIRLRGSALFASGDSDPFDDVEEGFDAIFENPQFAGSDTSFWIRQQIPFIGGGIVGLSGRNALLPALRSSKELGQSNFINPGLALLGAGFDMDLTPEFRLSGNANHLWFSNTSSLQNLRIQPDIDLDIGWDLSLATIWRPKMSQNIVARLSGAALKAGDGFRDLYTARANDDFFYSVLFNLVLAY